MAFVGIRIGNGVVAAIFTIMTVISLFWTIKYSQYTTFPLTAVKNTWVDCREYAHEGANVMETDKMEKMKLWCNEDRILSNRKRATSYPELRYGNVNLAILLFAMYGASAIAHILFVTAWWSVYEEQLDANKTLAERWALFSYVAALVYVQVAYFCGISDGVSLSLYAVLLSAGVFTVYLLHLRILRKIFFVYSLSSFVGVFTILFYAFFASNADVLGIVDGFVWFILFFTTLVFCAIVGIAWKELCTRTNDAEGELEKKTIIAFEYTYLALELLVEFALGVALLSTVYSSS